MPDKSVAGYDMKNTNGQWYTSALFFETDQREPKQAVFTMKDETFTHTDGRQYISLKAIYMSYDHIPGYEYDFANEVLGGWDHWQKICEAGPLSRYITAWREEMEVKLRASAVKGVMEAAKGDKGFQAAKWLAEGSYAPKKRGRPSTEEVERERRIQAGVIDQLEDMQSRIQ